MYNACTQMDAYKYKYTFALWDLFSTGKNILYNVSNISDGITHACCLNYNTCICMHTKTNAKAMPGVFFLMIKLI
jgi:hypothetical protein